MLISFLALVALLDSLLGWVHMHNGMHWLPGSLGEILGFVGAPVAWLIGVAWHDCAAIGNLLGTRMALNEVVAYIALGAEKATLAPRSFTIATFALCGFANLGSIGMQIGGIGALVPEHRSHSKTRQVVATLGNQRANATDLHTDGAQVGEPAQRKSSNRKRARIERGPLRSQADVGDDLIQCHARAQQVADRQAVVPWYADEPGNRREDVAKNLPQRARNKRQAAVNPRQQHVEQSNQCEEADQHDGHIQGQLAAVDGAACNCAN